MYAVKIIERKKLEGRINYNHLKNDVEMMRGIQRSVKVVSFYYFTKTQNNYYLVMEYCNGGDLKRFIKARGGCLTEPEAKFILR